MAPFILNLGIQEVRPEVTIRLSLDLDRITGYPDRLLVIFLSFSKQIAGQNPDNTFKGEDRKSSLHKIYLHNV
jgi:hypothetical protein